MPCERVTNKLKLTFIILVWCDPGYYYESIKTGTSGAALKNADMEYKNYYPSFWQLRNWVNNKKIYKNKVY